MLYFFFFFFFNDTATTEIYTLSLHDALPIFEGRSTYRLILPLQGKIDQVVFVDAQTFLPRLIEWRELPSSGRRFVVTTIELRDVERTAVDDVPAGTFTAPEIGRVVKVAPAGRRLGERALTIRQARRLRPSSFGPPGPP